MPAPIGARRRHGRQRAVTSSALRGHRARCVNFLGDADSTAAICGEIAGALYGYTAAIDDRFKTQLLKWDDAEIALRAALLVARGLRLRRLESEATQIEEAYMRLTAEGSDSS